MDNGPVQKVKIIIMRIKPVYHLTLLLLLVVNMTVRSQARKEFSGDIDKFTAELTSFMGPNLNIEQAGLMNSFVAAWDSTFLDTGEKNNIINLSNLLVSKRMRPVPHFTDLMTTLMAFINYDVSKDYLNLWAEGLISLASQPSVQVSRISQFIRSTGLLITDHIIYQSPTVTWKITGDRYRFVNDSVFRIEIDETDLICFSQYDSAIITGTSGSYIPDRLTWYGNGGKVTWEKAGYSPSDVYAQLGTYSFATTSASYEADSVLFFHNIYFPEPVKGILSDRAVKISDPETAVFPKFETYKKKFFLEDIYRDVDFEGGLAFEGATVKGTGDSFNPSLLSMYRNDTLYVKVRALSFIFDRETIKSQSTSFTLYMEKDSIYHSDIAFTYNVPNREVNTFRSRFPTSRSPYFSSYHKMDMYFEYLTWKMDESKVTLSRARGASMGQAFFESVSFFNQNEFSRLMALDDFHPLDRVSKFAEWWYSETFPIDEFARWMKQSPEYATALCIELANNGFLFYDRANDEVTIKQKLYDYINSYARRQDYDVMSIISETQAPVDNAILNMRNYEMTINGVPRIFLSDSQKVAIFPYNRTITLEKNRSFMFDGVVQAGMITIFGHDFKFSYDTFKINLVNVDSIMLAVETDQRDAYGGVLARRVEDLIQMTNAELLIDEPDNKSGLKSLEQYPIFTSTAESYIFYDRIPDLEGVYPRSDFYFKLDPFTFENTDRLTEESLNLKGEFKAGRIMPTMRQTLTLQNDKSLGFMYETGEEGLEIYEANGSIYNVITMSNEGLKVNGKLNHLTASAFSEEFRLFPDSVLAATESLSIAASTLYPGVEASNSNIRWYPWSDRFIIEQAGSEKFSMFENGTTMKGDLVLSSSLLAGRGEINLSDSRIISNGFAFGQNTIQADTSEYDLKSISGDGYAFIAEDANTFIDFENQMSRFRLNTDSSLVKFPEVDYICTMTDFEYDMQTRLLSMTQRGKESSTLMPPAELLRQDFNNLEKPTFFSTNMTNDTISFSASKGKYMVDSEKVIAENVNYIRIADALIQPDSGIVRISKGARFDPFTKSTIAINNNHIIHDASVNIMRSTRYTASGLYDYIDNTNQLQTIRFDEIVVDSARSKGTGYIKPVDKFMLSPDFTFQGDVHLRSESKFINFLGSTGIVHYCENVNTMPVRFESYIDPENIMIPVAEKPRDFNGTLLYNGSYITIDSTHIYPAFLSHGKSWSDVPLVSTGGWLIFDRATGKYKIAGKEKLANLSLPGNIVTFDRNLCGLNSEGAIDLGLDFDLVKATGAGQVTQNTDSNTVRINMMLALDFHFSQPALVVMADEIRYIPTLRQIDVSNEAYIKKLQNLVGSAAASTLKEEMDLYGTLRSFPKGFEPEIVLNNLNLVWNEEYRSYRSTGKIGIGFIGTQAINLEVDGYVELQKRRSGDLIDIYLKVDNATWYWFSYTRGVMMSLSGNNNYNTIIREEKLNDRKHKDNSVRTPYTYMIGVQERFDSFLRRMNQGIEEPVEEERF